MEAAELTRRREALGWSRPELARRVGVAPATVWRWEVQNKRPIAAIERVLEHTLRRAESRRRQPDQEVTDGR